MKSVAGALIAGALLVAGCEAGQAGGSTAQTGRSATSDSANEVDKHNTGTPSTKGSANPSEGSTNTTDATRLRGGDAVQGRAPPRPRANPAGTAADGGEAKLPDAGGAAPGGAGQNTTYAGTPAMGGLDGGPPKAGGRPQGGDTDGGTGLGSDAGR